MYVENIIVEEFIDYNLLAFFPGTATEADSVIHHIVKKKNKEYIWGAVCDFFQCDL